MTHNFLNRGVKLQEIAICEEIMKEWGGGRVVQVP